MTTRSFLVIIILVIQNAENSVEGESPNNWIGIQGSCYKFSNKSLNWTASKSACEALGSKLAVIHSQSEQEALVSKIPDPRQFTWIGLYQDPKDENSWLWVDGTRPNYTHWNTGEPNTPLLEKCAQMHYKESEGKWNDRRCALSYPYVCETPTMVYCATTTASPTTTSTSPAPPTTKVSSTDRTFNSQNISKTEELVNNFTSTLNRTDVRQNTSLKESVNLLQYTIEQFKNVSIREVQLNIITEQEKKEFLFKMAVAFEDFAQKYGRYHLNESMPQINNDYGKLVLRIRRVFRLNASDFHLEGPEKQTFIKIPLSNFDNNGSVLVAIMYTDLHELLKSNPSSSDVTKNARRLDTIIMAVSMDPKRKLQQNVVMNFRNLKDTQRERQCVFWSGFSEKNPDGWSGEGCHAVASKSNSEQTECSCNHLTHFAVLFDYSGSLSSLKITKTDEKILTILTYVGLALSIIGIILTIISYALLTDVQQPLSQIRVSLAGSLGAGQIIFLAGIDQINNTGACVTVAALMQYFLMAAFCWMLVEGIYLYLLVVKVYNINDKMSIYHVMSWGVPAVMVAMSLSIAAGEDGIQSFVSNKYCWMSSANKLIWIFAAFVVVIEVLNLLILVRVIKEMTTMQPTGDKHIHQIRVGIRACVVMIPLLGVTWLFGLVSPLHKVFVYIFTILNSTQGFLIFLLHCVRNTQIRERFKGRINQIFPATNNGISAKKKSSQVNQSDVGALQLRAIELQRCSDVDVIEL